MVPPDPPSCHTGESRYPRPPWVPAFAGVARHWLAQLLAFAGALQEDVGLEEHRQHQRAVRRFRDVAVALGAPDVIAGGDFALVVLEAAFEDKGLLDLDMLVEGQLGRRPAASGRGRSGARCPCLRAAPSSQSRRMGSASTAG